MTITEKIIDHVKEDQGVYDSVMYGLSSWGTKYYISKSELEQYRKDTGLNYLDPLTNVLYIHQ